MSRDDDREPIGRKGKKGGTPPSRKAVPNRRRRYDDEDDDYRDFFTFLRATSPSLSSSS